MSYDKAKINEDAPIQTNRGTFRHEDMNNQFEFCFFMPSDEVLSYGEVWVGDKGYDPLIINLGKISKACADYYLWSCVFRDKDALSS